MATAEASVAMMTREELREFVEIIVDEKNIPKPWYTLQTKRPVSEVIAAMRMNRIRLPADAPTPQQLLREDRDA